MKAGLQGSHVAAVSAGTLAVLLATVVASAPVTGCGGKSTEPSSACDHVYAALGGGSTEIVIVGCHPGGGQIEQHFTNITYNSDGTVRSFDFDARCTTTGEHYSGSVYTIRYQGGVAVGYSLKVNGLDCGPQ